MSFEMRKMTHFLREDFGCLPCKIILEKKEIRVWKVPFKNIEEHELNNTDIKAQQRLINKSLALAAEARADKTNIPF